MIIGSDEVLTIGQRVLGVFDNDGVWHGDQPLVALRQATYEEWLAEAKADGLSKEHIALARKQDLYYEVSLD